MLNIIGVIVLDVISKEVKDKNDSEVFGQVAVEGSVSHFILSKHCKS